MQISSIHLEHQEQIVSQHHQLKSRFIGPELLEQQMPYRQIKSMQD